MRRLYLFPFTILFISTFSLTGCGVTKLWGDDDPAAQNSVRTGPSMREQADAIADPVWEIEEKRSLANQMAGVLINGARSAGQALDVFDWTGSESAETRQAKKYLEQVSQRDNYTNLISAVLGDILNKNQAATAIRKSGIEALDYYHSELVDIGKEPDNAIRKDRTKKLFNDADEDRRAAIQASKSLRQQVTIFAATAEVLKASGESPDVEPLEASVEQLLDKARELRALAKDLDLD